MNQEHSFVTDKIEVRSSQVGGKPRYHVRGYALVPNMKDIYKSTKGADGKIRTFKSMRIISTLFFQFSSFWIFYQKSLFWI